MEHFGARLKRRPSSVPMQKIIAFAIFRQIPGRTTVLGGAFIIVGGIVLMV